MSFPLTIRLACGCPAVWNDREGQYNSRCTCPKPPQQVAQRVARQRSHNSSKRRQDAPLYRKPFSILR
jgi:hypothetical protein